MTKDELRAGVEKSSAYQERLAAECRAQIANLREKFEAEEGELLAWLAMLEGKNEPPVPRRPKSKAKSESSGARAFVTKEAIEQQLQRFVSEGNPLTEDQLWDRTHAYFCKDHSMSGARRIFNTIVHNYATAEAAQGLIAATA